MGQSKSIEANSINMAQFCKLSASLVSNGVLHCELEFIFKKLTSK